MYEKEMSEENAGKLYEHYCKEVGGKAFNGDPLPSWVEFRADPTKEKQSDAWVEVAKEAHRLSVEYLKEKLR